MADDYGRQLVENSAPRCPAATTPREVFSTPRSTGSAMAPDRAENRDDNNGRRSRRREHQQPAFRPLDSREIETFMTLRCASEGLRPSGPWLSTSASTRESPPRRRPQWNGRLGRERTIEVRDDAPDRKPESKRSIGAECRANRKILSMAIAQTQTEQGQKVQASRFHDPVSCQTARSRHVGGGGNRKGGFEPFRPDSSAVSSKGSCT